MLDPTCENCMYFRQHYILFYEGHYNPVPCGHCVFPRLKHRRPDTPACVYYAPRTEKEGCDYPSHSM